MKLLYLEDEAELARLVRGGLEQAGFVVDWAATLEMAFAALRHSGYDLLIIDRQLPDGDGLTIVAALRARGLTMPIICATAHHKVAARVEGLNGGADDYIGKPIALVELVARIGALLRRPTCLAPDCCAVGNLELTIASRAFRVNGIAVPLSRREGLLLEQLMRRAGQVIKRQNLQDALLVTTTRAPRTRSRRAFRASANGLWRPGRIEGFRPSAASATCSSPDQPRLGSLTGSLASQLLLLFAIFIVALAGFSAVQLGNIDETARQLRLERQWEEVRPFIRSVPPARAEVALPQAQVAEYRGPDAQGFFALWAGDGSLVTASSAPVARRLASLGTGGPPQGVADIGPIIGGEPATYVLTRSIEMQGSRLFLSVGHSAWASDGLLREVETRLLRQMLLAATGLGSVMALVFVLLVRRRLAPVRSFAKAIGDLDLASTMTRLDQKALAAEVRVLAAAFEQVLVRLHRSAKRQQRFSADAAHQLLTPLSILQARLDCQTALNIDPRSASETDPLGTC